MKEIINPKGAPAPIGPYSRAVKVGNMLFTSGSIALDEQGNLYTGDIKTETKMVMDNLQKLLVEAGADFNNVVKTSIFLADMNDFAVVNEVYASYFSGDYPARETVQVSKLPLNVLRRKALKKLVCSPVFSKNRLSGGYIFMWQLFNKQKEKTIPCRFHLLKGK